MTMKKTDKQLIFSKLGTYIQSDTCLKLITKSNN